MVNCDWITPSLAVGGRFHAHQVEALARDLSVRAVVDLRLEDCDDERLLDRHGIAFLYLPTPDLCAVAHGMLDDGVAFVRAWHERDARVLVHCEYGIGRSATLALCVLVDAGLAPLDALALMKARRARTSPSAAQYEAWAAWLRRRGMEPPDFDSFAAIAYRTAPV
jgi:protein-tyrosine phosphatase